MGTVTMGRKTGVARGCAVFLAVVTFSSFVLSRPQPVRADTAAQLAAAQKKLDGLIKTITAKSQVVADLESQASDLAAQVDQVQSQLSTTQSKIDVTEQSIRKANGEITKQQALLDQRAWIAYEGGPGSGLDFILGSKSLADLADRLEIINHAAKSDSDLIAQITNQRNQLTNQQKHLLSLERDFAATKKILDQRNAALEAKLAAAKSVVQDLEKAKVSANGLIKKLKQKRAKEIALAKLRAAEAAKRQHRGGGGGGTVAGQPFSVCPVDNPHGYSDSFGAPRYSGGYHPHAGNDIFATLGTPIRAPFAGVARNATNGLGGAAVIETGADGWTYNAHLSGYGTLGSVSAGTIIGYVGNSGDAAGGPTHDHFEWHPNVIPSNPWVSPYGYSVINGSAIDPYPYLNQVC
jgi:peptidoglycan hydrolase CwlO-like protein